jgi:CHAT domain-containing protein
MACQDTNRNAEATKTLFELLLPVAVKESSLQQGNMVLLVDQRSARYPWELLENRWGIDDQPPSIKAGMIRQFKTSTYRGRPARATADSALVIGNPDLGENDDFADLPGAQDEARGVADTLAQAGFDVTDRIGEKPTAILEALHKDKWRVLHLAGHGVSNYQSARMNTPRSGMVIGLDTILTPGDIELMRWVPELVFINCCHIGKIEAHKNTDPGSLAANLAEHFINMGVKAVIAAGWAVDDRAGKAFAEAFTGACWPANSLAKRSASRAKKFSTSTRMSAPGAPISVTANRATGYPARASTASALPPATPRHTNWPSTSTTFPATCAAAATGMILPTVSKVV